MAKYWCGKGLEGPVFFNVIFYYNSVYIEIQNGTLSVCALYVEKNRIPNCGENCEMVVVDSTSHAQWDQKRRLSCYFRCTLLLWVKIEVNWEKEGREEKWSGVGWLDG